MDLDAILARKPNTCIVDELAHTNVPGSRNRKRYQDVIDQFPGTTFADTARDELRKLRTAPTGIPASAPSS